LDKSGTIDTYELRDAMKSLGIFMNKAQTASEMERIDRDGSGSIEKPEFMGFMAELLEKRN